MNISQLAKIWRVDRHSALLQQGLLQAPNRQDNGYRSYTLAHGGC
jgi:DNA-binding transcriptional MerR regulator